MINLEVSNIYIDDLSDDFLMNETLNLYEFIDNDPVKAFYLGVKIGEWFEKLEPKQKYLYSKQVRHNNEDISKYDKQIKFWTDKFGKDECDLIELSEYIINNMIYDPETENSDKIKLSFFFGQCIAKNETKSMD